MKGRSHRLQSSDPHDDWVDGSWTVDCVCGVNFDDGEEMVNCDECSVWVHTRCSRYVKSEESFACDKCKNKNSRNDSKEKEVAQLLVELPTKTLRIENSYAPSFSVSRPFKLWTDIPMEERVHVQGVPGGDPGLFDGMSSVFSKQLWKCTGYVPKKFKYQYKEPCWNEDDKEEVENINEKENPDDNGADVLFSLSKDGMTPAPLAALVGTKEAAVVGTKEAATVGTKDSDDKDIFGKKVDPKDTNCDEMDNMRSQNLSKGQRLFRPMVSQSNRKRKEVFGAPKNRFSKKKIEDAEKEEDETMETTHVTKALLKTNSDAKQLEPHKDNMKIKCPKETVFRQPLSDNDLSVANGAAKMTNISMAVEHSTEMLPPSGGSELNYSIAPETKNMKADVQALADIQSPLDFENTASLGKDAERDPTKKEGDCIAVDKSDVDAEGSPRSAGKLLGEGIHCTILDVKGKQIIKDVNGDMSQTTITPKLEIDNNNYGCALRCHSLVPVDAEGTEVASDGMPANSNVNDASASSSRSSERKTPGADRIFEALSDCNTDRDDEFSDPFQGIREREGSEGLSVQKISSQFRSTPELVEEPSKFSRRILDAPPTSCKHETVVCGGKSSSTSSTTGKSSSTDDLRPTNSRNLNSSSKQQLTSDNCVSSKKVRASSAVVRDGDMLRKVVKEQVETSLSSKIPHSSRGSHTFVSKRSVSDTKDILHSSSSAQNMAGSGEAAGSLENQCAVPVQHKMSSSFLRKGEKLTQQHPSSKNSAQLMHPPAASASATLSDEELALLLHQELNSSPRVPRVPRVRNTGSLPQLASQSASSMLIKRTSSSGGKDYGSVSKRKNKDGAKENFRSSHDVEDGAKKSNKSPPSPEKRRQDRGHIPEPSAERDCNEYGQQVHSLKGNNLPSTPTNPQPSSSNEIYNFKLLSPRSTSDEDMGTVQGPVHRTLPGLINEIMSQGRRMAYEELCNAVLPHWPNLRKHNGERYAYSSHSQAVLDCLRNRHEWAQLVDRGPKTNSSRKRRKLDEEESEDNEYVKEAESRSLEPKIEEYPKGKRKARQRRRLDLKGREVKDVRKQRKAVDFTTTDEDTNDNNNNGLFSGSSEESMSTEDGNSASSGTT